MSGTLLCRCGPSRVAQDGHCVTCNGAVPPTPSRLPTPEGLAAVLWHLGGHDNAVSRAAGAYAVRSDRADILARLDAGMTLDALRAELRGAS